MKKIHEILGIDPESWELLPKKEKIDKIIIAIEREADSFDFKLWNKNFTVWINSNVSVLIKKLKNDDTIDAKKIHFFRDWSNIAEGAMKANLVRYDDNNPNYSWKFKIKESLKVFDSLYILYKEWFDLIISGDDKNLLIQIEQRDREELFLNISKKTSSHISDEVWKRLKEKLILKISRKAKETTGRSIDDYVKKVFNDEIKKSLENKTMSGAALKVLDYDYLKYKEIFEFDDENEFTEIKQKMIENLENILFLGLSSDTAKEEEEMNEGIGGGKEKEIETEKGKEPKEEVENEKGSDLRVEELEKLLKEKDEEVEKLKKEARLFLERFSGQAGQGISRPKIVTFNKKPELLSAEQKYKIVESENIFKLEQEIKEFEQKISEYDDLLSVLLREQVLWKADKEKIKELKVETSHLKEIVKQLKKEKTDYFSHFFEIYLKYLAEVDGKPMNTKKKFEYFKKASSSLHQNQEQLQKLVLSDQISHLQNQKTFLIKKSVELAGYKTQAENLQAHLDLAHQDIETLTGQNTYYQDQDTKLRVTIKDLQD
ncbi:MAG: hypothetical protein I3270_02760, partial [Candidatus Moeniiplasma glomeromycotorum]|nr:hypothetical protein [Candidatus Moeniiplasma glomeromycotorum]MCE8162531.1 hypothetical protein [Candidatus Moeniiplasma glomeromycotorum]MCE8166543.1 hypothetical protein [Candidatus Moeniiplasma glomeromycotorum]MCE8166986.1 hypothetical protein [Candidatus Moeniiplasma glomeromycotorum]